MQGQLWLGLQGGLRFHIEKLDKVASAEEELSRVSETM